MTKYVILKVTEFHAVECDDEHEAFLKETDSSTFCASTKMAVSSPIEADDRVYAWRKWRDARPTE